MGPAVGNTYFFPSGFKSRSLGSSTKQPTFGREESGVKEMFPTNLYILEHKLGLFFMYTNVLATAYHFYPSNVKWSNLFIFSYKGLTWDSQPVRRFESLQQVQYCSFVQIKIGLLATGKKQCIFLSHNITHTYLRSVSLCMTQDNYVYLLTVVEINIFSPNL